MKWREREGVRGALGRFAEGILLRSGGAGQGTGDGPLFWHLVDLSLLLSVLHAALVPFWPALRYHGPITRSRMVLDWTHLAITILVCISGGMIIIDNLSRYSVEDEAPITLNLRGATDMPIARPRPNPTTGQAAAALVLAGALMLASASLN